MSLPSGRMSFQEAIRYLEGRGFGIKASLARMRELTALLDEPQLTYPTIHLAGTNGKTTTARLTSSILAAHGLKVGTYTSPHLLSLRERFVLSALEEGAIVSDEIDENGLAEVIGYLAPFIELVENQMGETMSYFEITTAAAFEWMSQSAVGAGVYEAGLGGRWDATNLVEGSVAVLTHIAVDHREFLGATPQSNAAEKVGIIKEGSHVVSAEQSPAVLEIIRSKVSEVGATLAALGEEFRLTADELAVGGRVITVNTPHGKYEDLVVPLFGSHQSRNAAVAIAACESFIDAKLDEEALRLGLISARSPGRIEILRRDPLVIIDGAHNPDGAAALASAILESFGEMRRTLVLTAFKDKDVEGILKELVPLASKVICSSSSSDRSLTGQELADACRSLGVDAETVEPLEEAIDRAVGLALDDELVLVTGSIYGIGQARAHLDTSNHEPPS